MALSIIRVTSLTTSQAEVLFSDNLDTNIGINNISIEPSMDNIPTPDILSVETSEDTIIVDFSPIFPAAQYKIAFFSTDTQSFQTENGEIISEDGKSNVIFIVSPEDITSPIRDNMLDSLSKVYDTDNATLVRDTISSIARQLQKTNDAIKTIKSDNYLSIPVEDEVMTRGSGPVDSFTNGGVFELTRVGLKSSNATNYGNIRFDSLRKSSFVTNSSVIVNSVVEALTEDPISAQFVDVINEEVSDTSGLNNSFDGMIISVSKKPVAQLISLYLVRNGTNTYYDIENFGYMLLDNKFDTQTASKNLNLESNQFELSSSSLTGLSGGFIEPIPGDKIIASYVYKKLGRKIDESSVDLSTTIEVVREIAPALAASFSLNHSSIILSNGNIPEESGVEFLNSQIYNGSAPFSVTHPAFTREIPYDLSRPPAEPGEFSINYSTGQVIVFGEDLNNYGTGQSPPSASYFYKKSYVKDLDFTIDADANEIAIRSDRNIADTEAILSFSYDNTLADGEDFKFSSHIEVLNERIDNRMIGTSSIKTINYPITNVFRVFNETTGEIYTIDRFSDTTIYFSGRDVPKQNNITRERVGFNRISQETLITSDELTSSGGFRVFKIELLNSGITDSKQRFIGSSFDTSVSFSDLDIFAHELFYEDRLFTSVTANLSRLSAEGDYLIDYTNGIIYVAVSSSQDSEIGDISYQHSDVLTKNDHILSVSNIYRSASVREDNITNFMIGDIGDTTVNISNLEDAGQRFINNDSTRPLIVGSYQNGIDGITTSGVGIFTSNGAVFTADDIGRVLNVGSSTNTPVEQVTITGIIGTKQVLVTPAFSTTKTGRVWDIFDVSPGATKTITLDHDILSIDNIYSVTQLGSVSSDKLDGYFSITVDSFENNIITLGSSNILQNGDAVIVNYNYGDIFVDYTYLNDEVLITYEYGNNCIDWSISDSLSEGDNYFVSYKYGALREALLKNFGALTQIPSLTNFPYDFNREVYRSIVGGTLQSFIEGPTVNSIKRLVKSFTGVDPNIRESAFDSWILGQNYLYRKDIETKISPSYSLGKFGNGISLGRDDGQTIEVAAVSHLRLEEGTVETWVRPNWKGVSNDASITLDLAIDGYVDVSRIFIGSKFENPSEVPFTISVFDTDISVLGKPSNIDNTTGYFVWFDELEDKWNLWWKEELVQTQAERHIFTGIISTDGEFFRVDSQIGSDGYEISEICDLITSGTSSIKFEASIDVHEGEHFSGVIDGGTFLNPDFESVMNGGGFLTVDFDHEIDGGTFSHTVFVAGQLSEDGIAFCSGKIRYIMDMASADNANRMSIFKDGNGYLNFQVLDDQAQTTGIVGKYNLSTDIRDWGVDEMHQVAASWRFNSPDEMDEMHLFVDGQEAPNLFKYGGNPKSTSYNFGNKAEEVVISNSSKPIVGGFDGSSSAGSSVFASVSIDFTAAGVAIGDILQIMEDNSDGTNDPITGGAYTINGIGSNTLLLDRALGLTIGNIQFSINQQIKTINTPVNYQKFIVITRDLNGIEHELNGIDTNEPDYEIRRGSHDLHILIINNGVAENDDVIIKTLGLVFRKCHNDLYVYKGNNSQMRISGPAPVSLADVNVTEILLPRIAIDYGMNFSDGLSTRYGTFYGDGYLNLDGYVPVSQPSNSTTGRRLTVHLSGDNLDFSDALNNRVIIHGEAASGNVEEEVLFDDSGSISTVHYWMTIDYITVIVTPIEMTNPSGLIEVRETSPINKSENYGDYAELTSFENGVLSFEIYGAGGVDFVLPSAWYEIEYPSFLKINITNQPDTFFIGTDHTGASSFDGTIDEFRILKKKLTDVRAGVLITSISDDTITEDYGRTKEFVKNNDTLLLGHFDSNMKDYSNYVDAFDDGFETSESVNELFDSSLLVSENRPYIINNASNVFNNNEGTMEFWISPLDDSNNDPNLHYYLDMSSTISEDQTSITKIVVMTSQRIRELDSVRLATDTLGTGTNYYTGGSISSVDGKTIYLGTPLPSQNTEIVVTYVPLNNQGDRVSIFKDDSGFINFYMKATDIEHMVSCPVAWDRHTWHRIMVMWITNSTTGLDRLRLFVDGDERGTIKYGTGLLYGSGVIYGQAIVGSGIRYVTDNIDLTDTFSRIFIGTDTYRSNSARARLDNIRFSEIERTESIKSIGGVNVDINYVANTDVANPVVQDDYTRKIVDFNKDDQIISSLSTLINEERGIYRFNVEVFDSFDKLGTDQALKDLLVELINKIKPAHSEAIVKFMDDE